VRAVRFVFDDGTEVVARYDERPELQATRINQVVTRSVRVVILETSAPGTSTPRDFTPISELAVIDVPQQ
jgi:hypothetical protein